MFLFTCLGSLCCRLTFLQPTLPPLWPNLPETLSILAFLCLKVYSAPFLFTVQDPHISKHSLLLHHRACSPPCFRHTCSRLSASAWSHCAYLSSCLSFTMPRGCSSILSILPTSMMASTHPPSSPLNSPIALCDTQQLSPAVLVGPDSFWATQPWDVPGLLNLSTTNIWVG